MTAILETSEIPNDMTIERLNAILKNYQSLVRDTSNYANTYSYLKSIGDRKIEEATKSIFETYIISLKLEGINYLRLPYFLEALEIIIKGANQHVVNNQESIQTKEELISYVRGNYLELIENTTRLSLFIIEIRKGDLEFNFSHNDNVLAKTKEYHDDLKDTFIKSGIHSFAIKYSKIAGDEGFAKVAWLTASFLFFAGIICVISIFTCNIINLEEKTPFNLLYLYAERIPVIAILLGFFVWVSKRYTTAREKEVVYRHLSTTLHVFKSFYKTAEPEHKSFVIMEAAKVLFPAPIDNNISKSPDSEKMLEVAKLLSKAIGKKDGPN